MASTNCWIHKIWDERKRKKKKKSRLFFNVKLYDGLVVEWRFALVNIILISRSKMRDYSDEQTNKNSFFLLRIYTAHLYLLYFPLKKMMFYLTQFIAFVLSSHRSDVQCETNGKKCLKKLNRNWNIPIRFRHKQLIIQWEHEPNSRGKIELFLFDNTTPMKLSNEMKCTHTHDVIILWSISSYHLTQNWVLWYLTFKVGDGHWTYTSSKTWKEDSKLFARTRNTNTFSRLFLTIEN